MSLTRDIVQDAMRESNLIALGAEPDAAQGQEAMRLLNRIVAGIFGNEVGENLNDWVIPGPYGLVTTPWLQWLPPDIRLILGEGAGAQTFKLNPYPANGDRIQLIDSGSGFAANPVTLQVQAAQFEGSSSDYVADPNGFNQTWIYRDDTSNWARVLPVDPAGEFPFPEAYDDAFVQMLALRLSPRYQQQFSDESRIALQRNMNQLKAFYSRTRVTPSDLATIRLTQAGYGGWAAGDYGGGPYTTQLFLNGIPW